MLYTAQQCLTVRSCLRTRNVCNTIIALYSVKVDVPKFKGRTYRVIDKDELSEEVLEGMYLLELKRAHKWQQEAKERAVRRSQGIMYDEVVLKLHIVCIF